MSVSILTRSSDRMQPVAISSFNPHPVDRIPSVAAEPPVSILTRSSDRMQPLMAKEKDEE